MEQTRKEMSLNRTVHCVYRRLLYSVLQSYTKWALHRFLQGLAQPMPNKKLGLDLWRRFNNQHEVPGRHRRLTLGQARYRVRVVCTGCQSAPTSYSERRKEFILHLRLTASPPVNYLLQIVCNLHRAPDRSPLLL